MFLLGMYMENTKWVVQYSYNGEAKEVMADGLGAALRLMWRIR